MSNLRSPTDITATYFDLEAALDRCCDDPDFLVEMIEMLEDTVPAQLAAIETAIRANDADSLSRSAHALKGAVASMTTATPYALAYEIEFTGKAHTCEGTDVLFASLQISLEQLLRETRAWVDQHRAGSA
jgi:HPt (histidine-containing phosphotransfer) domain-containing protein